MDTQEKYNEWFRLMLSKYLRHHLHEISEKFHEDVHYLTAEIRHPIDQDKNIIISTNGRELTLFFWKHHEHHDSFEDDNHENEFKDLCEYIDDIKEDKVFFAVGYKNDRVAYVTASYKLEELFDKKVEKIEIKSWSGKHDQIIENKG
jgi:uncharacterized Zn finger protein